LGKKKPAGKKDSDRFYDIITTIPKVKQEEKLRQKPSQGKSSI